MRTLKKIKLETKPQPKSQDVGVRPVVIPAQTSPRHNRAGVRRSNNSKKAQFGRDSKQSLDTIYDDFDTLQIQRNSFSDQDEDNYGDLSPIEGVTPQETQRNTGSNPAEKKPNFKPKFLAAKD